MRELREGGEEKCDEKIIGKEARCVGTAKRRRKG